MIFMLGPLVVFRTEYQEARHLISRQKILKHYDLWIRVWQKKVEGTNFLEKYITLYFRFLVGAFVRKRQQ